MQKNVRIIFKLLKRSFSYKVIRAFLLALVVIQLLYFGVFQAAYDILTDEISQKLYAKMSFLTETLEEEVGRIQKLLYECVNDDTLYYTLEAYPILSRSEQNKGLLALEKRLTLLKESTTYIEEVAVYIPAARWKISATDGFRKCVGEGEKFLKLQRENKFSRFFYDDGRIYMGASYPYAMVDEDSHPVYILMIELKKETIRKTLDILEEYPNSGVRLADSKGQYEVKIGKDITPENIPTGDWWQQEVKDREDGQTYTMFQISSDFLEMDLFASISNGTIYGQLYLYRNLFFVVVFVIIMMMGIYLYAIHTLINQPIQTLTHKIGQMEQGKLEVRIEEKREDEFGYLYVAFNRMAESLQRQLEINYRQKLLTQQAQLRQLQSQINPHFLYNSFFSIYRMAKNEDNETIEEFSFYLGEYYRYITKDARSDTTLKMETEHAGRYAQIQAMRFKRRLRVELETLPERFEKMIVPRLILQPLLENAFEHGLNNVEKGGVLKVWYETKEGKLYIHVQDNGSGMTEKELEKIEENLSRSEDQIENGLSNINKRLKLWFGEQYGIEIRAKEAEGTFCSLVLPEEKESDGDVSSVSN